VDASHPERLGVVVPLPREKNGTRKSKKMGTKKKRKRGQEKGDRFIISCKKKGTDLLFLARKRGQIYYFLQEKKKKGTDLLLLNYFQQTSVCQA